MTAANATGVAASARDRFNYIDGLRGLAVLSVLLAHAMVTDFDGRGALSPDASFALSHGVDLFFAISGLCLANRFAGGRPVAYQSFLVRRFVRIAPPFYVALFAFAAVAHSRFGLPGYRSWGSDTLHSLLFAIPLYGARVNGSFWTLAIEARWYLVCPALVLLYRRSPRAFVAAAFASYALYSASNVFDDAGYLPCFMLGIIAADLERRSHVLTRFAPVGVLVFLPIAIVMPARGINVWHCNPIWHLAVFAIVLSGSQRSVSRVLAARPLRAVGVASYSIYLTHLPVLLWFGTLHLGLPIAIVGTLTAGFGFWMLIERTFLQKNIRSAIERLLIGMLDHGRASIVRRMRQCRRAISTLSAQRSE